MSIPQSGGGPIERHEQMAEYLADGCKPREEWRIGTEHEKFGYCKDSLRPLPFEVEHDAECSHRFAKTLRVTVFPRLGWENCSASGEPS